MKVTLNHNKLHIKRQDSKKVGLGTRLSYYGAVLQEVCIGGCHGGNAGTKISGFLIGRTRLNYSCVGSPC